LPLSLRLAPWLCCKGCRHVYSSLALRGIPRPVLSPPCRPQPEHMLPPPVLDRQNLGTVFPRAHPTSASHERIPRARPLYLLAKKAGPRRPFHCMNLLAGVAVHWKSARYCRLFPRTASRRDHPAISLTSHDPFGHERPSLVGSAPGPADSPSPLHPILHLATRGRPSWAVRPFPQFPPVPLVALKAPASPASRGLRPSLRSRPACCIFGLAVR